MDACSSEVNLVAALDQQVATFRLANQRKQEKPVGSLVSSIPSVPALSYQERMELIRQRDEEFAKQERERVNNERSRIWGSLVRSRGERYEGCRLRTFEVTTPQQEQVVKKLRVYLNGLQDNLDSGSGLLLFGPKGCGKDHLVMACAHAAIGLSDPSKFSIHWSNGMDIFARLRDTMSHDSMDTEEDVFKELARKRVLWISDPVPPSGSLTEFQQSFLFRVLDYRYNHLLTTWVTCNVSSGAELDARLGAQNGDRLRHGAHAIFTNWDSYRKVAQ